MQSDEMWTTKEGIVIAIKDMASSHLLNTIHMIEKKRFEQMVELQFNGAPIETLNVYAQWPQSYVAMIHEAERRNLIYNGSNESLREGEIVSTRTKHNIRRR